MARRPLDLVFASLEGHAGAAPAQALIALAHDLHGPRFDRVHVFDWDERREELRLWALGPERGPEESAASPPRALALLPERLAGAPATAWREGRPAQSAPALEDAPWRHAAEIGALALE